MTYSAKGISKKVLARVLYLLSLTPKKNGSQRICFDSRAIIKITVKYQFHIPSLDDMFDLFIGSSQFSKMNLRSGYYQIQIFHAEWKIILVFMSGVDSLYELVKCSFYLYEGYNTSPSAFSRNFSIIYFVDILIYRNTQSILGSLLRQFKQKNFM